MKRALKPVYRFYRMASGLRYWASRRFTKAGLVVVIAFVATGAMGVDTENTVAYQAFAPLLGVVIVAAILSSVFRGRFSATRLLPRFGTAGNPLHYSVVVQNIGKKTQTGLTMLETLTDARPDFQEWLAVEFAEQKQLRSFRIGRRVTKTPFKRANLKEAQVPALPPREDVSVEMELTPLRRGLLRFEALTFARPDPLGLFRAFVKTGSPQNVLVLPKRYLLPPIPLPGTMKYQQGGVALASHVGQSEEFVSLRDYRSGDPVRHIHWRSWARTGKPVVKEFEDEFFIRHALVLDTFIEHPYSDIFEEAVSLAASFACTIPKRESLLDLLFVGPESYCFTAGRGLGQADQMLEILASVRACQEKPFSSLEHLVLDHISAVSGAVCIFLAWDAARKEFVKKIRALGIPLLVLVIVGAGEKLESDPGPLRDTPQSFRVLEAGKIEQGLATLQ